MYNRAVYLICLLHLGKRIIIYICIYTHVYICIYIYIIHEYAHGNRHTIYCILQVILPSYFVRICHKIGREVEGFDMHWLQIFNTKCCLGWNLASRRNISCFENFSEMHALFVI